MKRSLLIIISTFAIFILTQSFYCGRPMPDPCSVRKTDTSYLTFNYLNATPTIKLYDTIWFESRVNDTFYNRAGNDYVVSEQNYLYQVFQPFKIEQNGTSKTMNYANIEFNPIIKDGSFYNYYSSGFAYNFRRNKPYNYLKVGFIAGKVGMYIISMNNGNNYYYDYLSIYSSNDYCKTFYGLSYVPPTQRNLNYWDTLQVSSLGIANGQSSHITKNSNNYILFKVIP